MGGGFIGVDVFFVLSGYLVTQVLMRDLDGPGGRVGFGRFYARRVRRLLPAAVVAIVVTAAAYGAVASLASLDAAADSFKAALLYVANWYFIAESADYFAPQDPSPVLHFWSLAVEEQFYVVWPLLLSGLWALAGRRGRTGTSRRVATASLVAVAAVASFALAMVLRSDAPTRAYFGTDTRAYQLLVGAGLALLPGLTAAAARHRAGRVLAPAGLAAIAVTASSLLDLDPFARSAITTVAAAALIVGVEAHQRSATSRAFGFAPIAYLGTISYATYLWHWPIIVIIGELGILTSATTLALVTALLATGIAALSSELLELPIRRSGWLDGHRGTAIAGGVGISALAAILLVPVLVDVERSRVQIDADRRRRLRRLPRAAHPAHPCRTPSTTAPTGGPASATELPLRRRASSPTAPSSTATGPTSSSSATATPRCTWPPSARRRGSPGAGSRSRSPTGARGSSGSPTSTRRPRQAARASARSPTTG